MLWDLIAERKLQEAFAEGLFENLSGAGKPLSWDDESLVPPGWRVAFHLLRHAGLAPPWITMDVEIRKDVRMARQAFSRVAALRRNGDPEYARAAQQFTRRVAEINQSIDELNLQVPSSQLTRLHLDPRLEIERISRAPDTGEDRVWEKTESEEPW
jgi:hypothetical protein